MRAQQQAEAGTPGPEQSTGKLAATENLKRVHELCVDLLGYDGLLVPGYELGRPTRIGEGSDDVVKGFLRSRANTIEGGTSEIMRELIGRSLAG